ncbi:MAG TPA: GDSL-type esterase/lipase family protein [Actinomycetota bacterium]|nr:GDSL-type esterase/lipase family protein [Actinomycetota bacterium]
MIRRLLKVAGLLLLALVVLVGVEILLAFRREYLPTDPPLELGGTFGPSDGRPLRFVVLGDSTAAGLGTDAAHAYATVLSERLARATDRRVELTVLGVSGARVQDVARTQAPAAAELAPDLVFIGIGANDVTHLTPLGSVEDDMTRALDELSGTGADIVVAGAPDMRVLAWYEPLRSLSYLRGKQVTGAIESAARAAGVAVVELAEETGQFFAAEPETHHSEDDFHPSAVGYARWADAIFPVLLETLDE